MHYPSQLAQDYAQSRRTTGKFEPFPDDLLQNLSPDDPITTFFLQHTRTFTRVQSRLRRILLY
ncbi:hypothetical protein PsorP6_013106 [Peronosclerospora sorghi]|uniref:Uncharacterized protein n=1 Tax=Peronosclerospora sorghi TaxID=230839 RepID=A0ACC0WI43_9STRA|nr:hypothetical protein PsorP6_013106 [Peronosclerospora sorghi]